MNRLRLEKDRRIKNDIIKDVRNIFRLKQEKVTT